MTDRKPWRCPDCGAMVAPHVDVHWCDKPDGGVTAKRPDAPLSPFTTTSVTTTFPGTVVAAGGYGGGGGTTVFVGEHGPEITTVSSGATVTLDSRELWRAVQDEVLRFRRRRGPDAA